MLTLPVSVRNRVATYPQRCGRIVCGNSDYSIQFTFDEEWEAYKIKTARFIWNGHYKDIEFKGDTCAVPIISNTDSLLVGVYAGDLRTTTSAVIDCKKSILCEGGTLNAEDGQFYVSAAIRAAERAEAAAFRAETAVDSSVIATLPIAEGARF